MGNKIDLNCFFCGKEIPAITRTETRSRGCHSEYSGEYEVEVIIPTDPNVFTIEFEPAYSLLEEDIQKAEKETQKLIAQATAAGNAVLKPFWEKLGGVSLTTRESNYGMRSSEEIRKDNARQFYELKTYATGFCGYNIKDFDIKPEGFKAHNFCVKKELTLEELAGNPLLKDQFKQHFAELPQPYQKLYDKLKSGKVNVVVKKFDLRDYL